MTEPDPEPREIPEDGRPRDRASALAAAILGISASLDLDTVLRKVVEGARGLTGARLGIIATVDESGAHGQYFFSGYTPEQERELVEWSGGLRMVEHLHELPGPLRVGDLPGYVRGLGLTPLPTFPGAFQGTPVRHRGMSVGYLYLGEKAGGGEFSGADEEMLVLFASQAAAAIVNARARRSGGPHRDLAGGRGGVRRAQRSGGVVEPRGAAAR